MIAERSCAPFSPQTPLASLNMQWAPLRALTGRGSQLRNVRAGPVQLPTK